MPAKKLRFRSAAREKVLTGASALSLGANRFDQAQQRKAAPGHDAFGKRGLRRADRVFDGFTDAVRITLGPKGAPTRTTATPR